MNEINFLPESFRRQQAAQIRVRREIALCAIVGAAMLGWFLTTQNELADLERHATAVENEAAALGSHVSEVARQKSLRQSLRQKVSIQRELMQPLGLTQVLATLSRLAPESIAITEMNIIGRRPQPRKVKSSERGGRSTRKSTRVSAVQSKDNVMTVAFAGLSPGDGEIADFLGRLSDHKLFENVKLSYSRSARVTEIIAREFQIEMEIPLDRDYRPVRQAGEVANAS